MRNQRLLLEARALSDMGRHDLALEVIGNLDGREVTRLRSDIYWAGRHWREAAEQIELLYGERWKDWQPLNDIERSDILRAELGYALGEDTLGLGRFREKYAAKMAGTPDAHAFEVVSAPLGTSGTEFAAIAHAAAAGDTLTVSCATCRRTTPTPAPRRRMPGRRRPTRRKPARPRPPFRRCRRSFRRRAPPGERRCGEVRAII